MAAAARLALCCDFVYAAETARFAVTEVTLGIMPGAGGTQNLPRALGARRAKEIIFTGRPFTAAEALGIGHGQSVLRRAGVRRRRWRPRAASPTMRPSRCARPSTRSIRAADRSRDRHDARDRGLQPHGADRGPARRRRWPSTRSANRGSRAMSSARVSGPGGQDGRQMASTRGAGEQARGSRL